MPVGAHRDPAAVRDLLGADPAVHGWAPGRINLIGEHVDHSGGLVLPATIDRFVHMWLAPAEAGHVVINTTLDQSFDIDRGTGTGRPVLHGLLLLVADRIDEIPPFRLLIEGDLPMGAGLSASAAFSVAFLQTLNAWLDIGLAPWDIVDLARDVEVRFLGLECGIMDPFIMVFAQHATAQRLDCHTRTHRTVPLPDDLEIVLIDSGVRHELAASAYNERQADGRLALSVLRSRGHDVPVLSAITPAMLDDLTDHVTDPVARNARHVLTENQRVRDMEAALTEGDPDRVGHLLTASHASLRDDYRVTCAETDALVTALSAVDGILGARQIGGGFGGSVLAIGSAPDAAIEAVCRRVADRFDVRPTRLDVGMDGPAGAQRLSP